jgi:hypothetical protein
MSTHPGRALLAHESLFGNTALLAAAVAQGLVRSGLDVDRIDIGAEGEAGPPRPLTSYDVLVVGAPTHAFSLSRPGTRADAVTQGAAPERAGRGLREWLAELPPDVPEGLRAAAFDSRVDTVRHLPGSAAAKAGRVLHRHGYLLLDHCSFYVTDAAGPLADGELARAEAWGAAIGARLHAETAPSH